MFSVSSEPVLLSEAGLHGLCVSLNTPVLNIDELPVGPARASIVSFDGGYGSLELAIGIRSVEKRQVVVYTFQGRIGGKKSRAQAMEAATAFAEGMGFLFDDDVVSSGSDGRSHAMRLWLDLTEVPDVSEELVLEEQRPQLSPAVPLEPPEEELVLEQRVELSELESPVALEMPAASDENPSEEIWLEAAPALPRVEEAPPVAAAPVAPAEPAAPVENVAAPVPAPRPSRTQFRQLPPSEPVQPAAAPPAIEAANGGSALGKIALVRKHLNGEVAEEKPSLLLRLLGSF